MKLQTSIKPRRNGTVNVAGLDGKTYTFVADDTGALVCDVDHDPTVAHLLKLRDFEPADLGDFGAAEAMLKGAAAGDGDDDSDDDVDDDDPEDAPGALDEAPAGGLPVEANTPPKARPGKGGKKARAA